MHVVNTMTASMESLLLQIKNYTPISAELVSAIHTLFKEEKFTQNEFLLREHQQVRKLYFVNKGILRTYYHHDGKDVTSWFYPENQFVTYWYGFYKQAHSHEYIEALDDSLVFGIDYVEYQKLIENHPQFERFARLLAEEQLAFLDAFYKGYMFMSAKDKYELLLSMFPDIELRVKLGHIASFLGISQETLSRIRKKRI